MNTNNIDEFGDDSFLDDFDMDAAIAKHNSVKNSFPIPSPIKNPHTSTSNPYSKSPSVHNKPPMNENNTKRQKITLPDPLPTLQKYFGYTSFRAGQSEAITSILSNKDTAIFWATGAGKSLVYQIPALLSLQSNDLKISVIISPLISLMQDQVHKLNNLDDMILATYLGSAQLDESMQYKALILGEIPLVYITPEKLMTVQKELETLASKNKLGLIAVDEAHCVSEWGHDFRPEFRKIGNLLRSKNSSLSSIPIVSLTATAVPKVRHDITASLYMKDPYISLQSLDRANLKLTVSRKENGGVSTTFKPLLDTLKQSTRPASQTTIIYAPSKKLVEEIATFFTKNLPSDSPIKVEYYHAGCSNAKRQEAHVNFVTSQTTVIVATVAFGMGIDKIDTRRIVHYGPPKTIEEYYQQAGRAGRDGYDAECILYTSNSDFDVYQSEYYLGGLSGSALEATKESMQALKDFVRTSNCRRKALLDYFQQRSSFGDRCGTCDNCLNRMEHEGDVDRDFRLLGALVVLQAIDCLNSQAMQSLIDVISGKVVEAYRYEKGRNANDVQYKIESLKKELPKSYPLPYYKELIVLLTQKGYIKESHRTVTTGIGFKKTFTVFDLSYEGMSALRNDTPIILPVPEYIRTQERKEKEKRQRTLAKLQSQGVSPQDLPAEEVEQGDGVVVRALLKWYNYIQGVKKNNEERYIQLQNLFESIDTWRNEAAVKSSIPPAVVLPEHLLAGIAYATATLPNGRMLDEESLVSIGLRSKDVKSLVQKLSEWVQASQPAKEQSSQGTIGRMILQDPFINQTAWKYAIYKPNKKTNLAAWEGSYNRFIAGESIQAIAMNPTSGKPIQVTTVVGHLMDAILFGRTIPNPEIIFTYNPLPNEEEWNRMLDAESAMGMDCIENPECSGKDGDVFRVTDLVRPIVGDEVCDKKGLDRSEEEREEFGFWCDRYKWFILLKRVGVVPKFSFE